MDHRAALCCTSIFRLPCEHPPYKLQEQLFVFATDIAEGTFETEFSWNRYYGVEFPCYGCEQIFTQVSPQMITYPLN